MAELEAHLARLGLNAEEFQEARSRGWLPLIALDHLLFPQRMNYTAFDLAAAAGVDIEAAERLWRAMGFTIPPRDDAVFGDDDLDALRVAVQALAEGDSLDEIVYQTRVMAAALARVAELSSDDIVARIDQLRQEGMTEDRIAEFVGARNESEIDRLLGYFFRRQLKAALWRRLADPERMTEQTTLTVAFVDLVSFTALTEDIAEDELGELIDRFETIVHERVSSAGARIVKMIGDEAMFVSEGADSAVDVAVGLIEDFAHDDSVPPARAGLARGSVLARGGDYFGPVVNLAARLVEVAKPSTVLAAQSVSEGLASRSDLRWRRMSPKRLKGIGRVSPLKVTAKAGQSRRSPSRGMGHRR